MYASRTAFDSRCMIKEARKYCDLDLEVVSMEGAVTQTSKILLALASHSPCLQALLTSDTPSRLLLPDVPTQSVHHLLNVLTQGYTTGLGSGDAVVKGMKEAAKVLGLPKFPVIAFEVEGNGAVWPSDQNVIQWSTERTQAEKDDDIVEVVEIDADNKDDDGVERESSDREIKERSKALKVLSVGDINKKHFNDSVVDINKKHLNDSVGDINKKHLNDSAEEINKKRLNDSVVDINKKHLNDSMGDINKKHLNDSVGDINKRHRNDSVGDINKKHFNVGDIIKKHLNDSVGDINKKNFNVGDIIKKHLNASMGDHQNENQPQRKKRRILVDGPKNVQVLEKVRHSSVQLDQVHQKETNLGEKVIVPSLRDEISSNLSSKLDKINDKNGNNSQPITRLLPKPKSLKNRPIISGRQQSGGRFPPKINPPANLTNQKSDDGFENFSVRKSAKHVAINSYPSTQPSPSYRCDSTIRVESESAAFPKPKDISKFKDHSTSQDSSKSQDTSKHQDSNKFQDFSKPKEASKRKGPSKLNNPNKTKDASKVSKMDCEVELVEHMERHNQEVTQVVPKVLKAEIDDENQNHEALDTILCGICYK